MATIVFDVNETLLDLSGLDEPFAELFGDRGGEVKRLWFARLLHASTVMTAIGTWQDFGDLGVEVLRSQARLLGMGIEEDEAARAVGTMRCLPPHPDVLPGLRALRDDGHVLVALTNSGQETAEAQLAFAGIDELMDQIMSVDATLRFKPDPAVYRHAEAVLDMAPASLVMVAAHDWDCAGALQAGWQAAFVARAGQAYIPFLPQPTWTVQDLTELVEVLEG